MSRTSKSSGVSISKVSQKIDWHYGIYCALKHDLRDYDDILSYEREHPIGNNYFRIDLLIIRKLPGRKISKALARDFREINIFENKGIGSSPGIDTYYKTIGYCGMYLQSTWKKKSGNIVSENYTAENITLNLLSRSYPRNLIRYLTETRNKTVVKISPGIYDVSNETFLTRIIVTRELPVIEYMYLRCLGLDLEKQPEETINKLTEDLRRHSDEKSYIEYVDLLTRANQKRKGETGMLVSEGLLEYFGTSSEEIRREQAEKDQALIDAANDRAENAEQRADSAEQRADYAELRANQYLAILMANGIQIPDEEQ